MSNISNLSAMSNMRYSTPVPEVMTGWLYKEGHILHSRTKRFMRLEKSILANHYDEASKPTWVMDIWNAKLETDDKTFQLSLELPTKSITLYAENKEEFQKWAVAMKRASCSGMDEFYAIGKEIGKGSYGVVMEGYDKLTKEKRAIKILKKTGKRREMEYLRREVNIMRSVNHPNVIRTYDIFDINGKLYLIMEYVPGGELFDIIAERKTLTEREAASIVKEILNGLAYLHSHKIVHRDIKPENILCMRREFPPGIKLTDFGLSNTLETESLTSFVGTPFYQAPEVYLKREYGPNVDIFAVGVVTFIMLSSKFPFFGRTEEEYRKRLLNGVVFPPAQWENISEQAKEFIKRMLCLDPKTRPTAEEALRDPWFMEESEDSLRGLELDFDSMHSGSRGFKAMIT